MADSSDDKKNPAGKSSERATFGQDELDKSIEKEDEFIDDEDAIERLLMDNAFDSPEDEEDEFAEIDELISEKREESVSAEDEDLIVSLDAKMRQQQEDQESDAVADSDDEMDEFADDEFADEDQDMSDQGMVESDESDLLIDFDISADEANPVTDVEDEPFARGQSSGADRGGSANTQPPERTPDYSADFSAITSQLAALQTAQDQLKQHLVEVERMDQTEAIAEDLSGLNEEQKKLRRILLQLQKKKPLLVYAALTVAILALLMGSGLGIVGLMADSKIDELSERVASLEEQLDAWVGQRGQVQGVNVLNRRLDKVDMEVANFSNQVNTLDKKWASYVKDNRVEDMSQNIAQLNERDMQMASMLEALQRNVDELKSKKASVERPSRNSRVVPKKSWMVNLVSFKQEWYAKRKAAEFQKQGVPAEVLKADVKGEIWYRLRVKGFASKYEAAAYAAKVKKSLNLPSVWVAKD